MGIFNGIEVLFFILGAMAVLLINGIVFLKNRYPFRWYTTLLAVLGSFLLVFTVAWSVSSIIEGETRSAGMGILVFDPADPGKLGCIQRLRRRFRRGMTGSKQRSRNKCLESACNGNVCSRSEERV